MNRDIEIAAVVYYILKDNVLVKTNDVFEWADFFSNHQKRLVDATILEDCTIITIVFGVPMPDYILGLTENMGIIGTSIKTNNGTIQEIDTYSTIEEAKRGHRQTVKDVQSKGCIQYLRDKIK